MTFRQAEHGLQVLLLSDELFLRLPEMVSRGFFSTVVDGACVLKVVSGAGSSVTAMWRVTSGQLSEMFIREFVDWRCANYQCGTDGDLNDFSRLPFLESCS